MKKVYRLTPVSQYDIPGLESWLEDMAGRGLFLIKFRPLFCTFTKGEPSPTRYRAEPHRRPVDEDLPQSMLELYEAFGWNCVGEIDRSMLIFSTQDPQARELHTDPEIQSGLWKKLHRSVRRGFILNLLLLALTSVLILSLLFGDGAPVLNLLTTSALPLSLFFLYELALLPASWSDLRRLSLIARQLKAGVPLSHRAPYPRRRSAALVSLLAAAALLAVLAASQWVLPFLGGGSRPLGELEDFVPLSLEALEGADYVPRHFPANGVDYANFCHRKRYLLCPAQWDVIQSGTPGGEEQWVRLEIQWYAPLIPALARPLAQEQLGRYMDLDENVWWSAPPQSNSQWTVQVYQREGLDYLAVARRTEGAFQVAAAAGNGKTAVARYTGRGDLNDHLEALAAMVTG